MGYESRMYVAEAGNVLEDGKTVFRSRSIHRFYKMPLLAELFFKHGKPLNGELSSIGTDKVENETDAYGDKLRIMTTTELRVRLKEKYVDNSDFKDEYEKELLAAVEKTIESCEILYKAFSHDSHLYAIHCGE